MSMYASASGINDQQDNGLDRYYTVDMRSDTLSTPTDEMRQAMANAIVGDDVYGEDPTVNELERRSAELLGKEAALFVTSGTMGNLIATMVHCNRRGTEAIVGDLSHVFLYEQGSAAQLGGVQLSTLPNRPDGTFCLKQLVRKIRGFDLHEPITSLVVVENTHNMCGGRVVPLDWLERLAKVCKEHSLKMHMDGARVFNAAQVLNVPVARIVKDFDSVCFCLSKGLSSPVGSILAGSKDFITQARRMRKALGGGMRQVGVLAAAGIVSLEKIVPRLGEDHKNILDIAKAINSAGSPNINVDLATTETNILLVRINNSKITSDDLQKRLLSVTEQEIKDNITDDQGRGIIVKVSARDWSFARIVSYHQITPKDVEMAIKKILYVIKEYGAKLQ